MSADEKHIRDQQQWVRDRNPNPELAMISGVLAIYEVAAQLAKLNAFIEAGVFDGEGDPR